MEGRDFPSCVACTLGNLLPLSDFGSQGAAIHYKAWVCSNPDCGFNIKIRNGDVYLKRADSQRSHERAAIQIASRPDTRLV